MDKYSDMMYLGAAALSVIGSIFAAIYAKITRIAPEKASELSTAILDIGERIEHAHSLDELECLQDELEGILRGAVVGLRDGTISTDGLDTFKLGYELVRDEIAMRREHLKRRAGDAEWRAGDAEWRAGDAEWRAGDADDKTMREAAAHDETNVVVVKTAQSG